MQKLKEYWQNLSSSAKKLLIAIVGGTAAIAIVGVLALYLLKDRSYSTLFTGLNQEEAQEVVSLLQDENIDYTYNDANGSIRVPAVLENETRTKLLSQGYPKSGFAYDIYLTNSGLMSTESDKELLTLYDLQNRLGAQIRSFSGVREATVTIVQAQESRYALGDESAQDASASVVVTMNEGQALSESQGAAIKRLIETAVRGMNFTNVSVFDAETMLEVGGGSGNSEYSTAKDATALATLVENNIAANIRRVLEKIYGQGTVAVSVKGTLNMDRLIQETTQYSTPEKIDEEDKTGLLQKESVADENSGSGGTGTGGVAGTDANADTPRYTNDTGGQNTVDSYANSSATREWLYNEVKEQRQIDPGVLENATVSVVIDTDDTTTVSQQNLTSLVANAAGIAQEDAQRNITIIRTPSADRVAAEAVPVAGETTEQKRGSLFPILIAAAAGFLVLALLLLFLFLRRRKKKKAQGGVNESLVLDVDESGPVEDFPKTTEGLAYQAEDEEMEKNSEILNLRMQRSLKLKQNIGEFIDQNPQIAAKLVQSWLRGEEDISGGKQQRSSAGKQK